MGLVDESLMGELPDSVISLHEVGYTITSLHKNNGEIVCVVEYGIREAYEWTIYVGEASDLRIRFTGVTNRETALIDYLTKKDVDLENAKEYSDSVQIRYEKLFDTIFNITGNHLSYVSGVGEDLYGIWDIRIDRDVTDVTLSYLADAVFKYVHINEISLRNYLNRK